jgi:hypothetical protein
MDILRDKDGRSNIRLIILVFAVLTGIVAALLYFPPILTRTGEVKTSGDITFLDGIGNPLSGTIEISGAGISGGQKSNVNYVSWTNVPNAKIYYNVLDTKSIAVNLRISGDSPKGRVMLENYGTEVPGSVNVTVPGYLVKYVEISSSGVNFAEADISIRYTDEEVRGLDESSLVIYRYDRATETWSEIPTKIDAKNNIVSTTVNSLSIFAVSTRIPDKIEVHDTKRMPVVSDIKTYDEAKNVKKAEKASALSAADIPVRGELEVDAIKTKNVAVRLKVTTPKSGEIILEDYGKKNPVAMAPPGTTIKYVDISAINVSYDSAEVRIAYTKADLGSVDESALVIYHWNGASWEALSTTVDAANNILTATTTSLSPFAASAGEGGQARVLVATNRYVILDDPRKPAGAKAGPGFALPLQADYTTWNSFSGINTMINATALFIDRTGMPVSNTNITFTLYDPNGTINTTRYGITNSYGLANVSFNLNDFNFYGKWNVKAANGTNSSGNTTFIYNWWGCSYASGTCGTSHSGRTPQPTGAVANSPYLGGRDRTTGMFADHTISGVNCTFCHQSFDGKPGDTNPPTLPGSDPNHTNYSPDVHRNISCNNPSCHGSLFTHSEETTNPNGDILIASCYNTSGGCHTPANRSDISNKSTLDRANVATAVSLYSYNGSNASRLFNATFHTPNSTVPCIICHGPMHNISKPDNSLRFVNGSNTESSQCTACHSSYQKHNASVNCTVCHSDDVHAIKVFAQNATYITLNKSNPSTYRGNCTNCHQNATFFAALEAQPKAGNYTGRDPPQVQVPLEHSEAPNAGQKWNQTPGYWNNSNQLTWCQYCHGNTTHYASALGRPSLFDGNNNVNSTISSATSWCASCHWQGYSSGANNYNDTVNTFNFPAENLLVPPEITGNATYGANQSNPAYYPHNSLATKDDATCKSCHGSLTTSSNITGLMHNVAIGVAGGANCTACHDIGGSAGAGKLVNISAMNDTNAIHKNLNSNATSLSNYPPADFRCWACHGNGSEPGSGHPTNYKTPYRCPDCHVPVAGQNLNFTPNNTLLNVSNHYWNGTNITTSNVTSCYSCHNRTEMMVGINLDPDGAGSVYSGANGGNNSTSHYGKKRTDMAVMDNTTYCSYCHNTTINNATFYVSDFNNTMINHTSRATTPLCTTCHYNGRIHNSTLAKPVSNDSFCSTCHGTGGSAARNNRTEHKTLYCTICHANNTVGALAGKDIHGIKYLTKNNNFSTSNSSAVDCTTCHQTSNVDSSLSR